MKGKLYLLPNFLSDSSPDAVFPLIYRDILLELREYIVENPKPARAFIKKLAPALPQSDLIIHHLDKHEKEIPVTSFLQTAINGGSVGLLSDAGCPGVADPGAQVVSLAHQLGIEVIPMVGPSSILLALMASGFNGQQFSFVGYLTHDDAARLRQLKALEEKVERTGETFIFIETPYRNQKLLDELRKQLAPQTEICIGIDLTGPSQRIRTQPLQKWSGFQFSGKLPAVFLLGRTGNR